MANTAPVMNFVKKVSLFLAVVFVRLWLRHNLENLKKRLKALEEKVAKDGIILSDAQVAALGPGKRKNMMMKPVVR